MSQSVNLLAGSYNVSFLAAQCANGQTQGQQIEVLVDGTEVGLITPVGTTYRSSTRRRISRLRPAERIPSSSWA